MWELVVAKYKNSDKSVNLKETILRYFAFYFVKIFYSSV